MYDKNDRGRCLRESVVCTLGWWHSFKTAAFLIYHRFHADIFAGLFHSLYPANEFFPKPSNLSGILALMSFINIGYPEFKAPLQAALANDDLDPNMKNHLLNIQSLCEFFIPVVTIYIVCVILFT